MSNLKVIDAVFLCESVTTRSNVLVMVNNAKNIIDRKRTSPYAKLGRIAGQTIRGWLRHATEKLLIQHGVSVCHPLSDMSVTGDRNKDYFQNDLILGYHSRGACATDGGCLIYNLFGDLDFPGNLITQAIYFYPTIAGNGSASKNINKVFGSVGGGRVELVQNSPRCRNQSHQTYMSMETLAGVMIEAPFKLILREPDHDQEILLLKTLEFLKTMVQGYEFDFLLGGMRTSGYGRAAILPLKPKKQKRENKSLVLEENEEASEESDTTFTIQFKLGKPAAAKFDKEFLGVIEKAKKKFPFGKYLNDKKEASEKNE